MTPHGARLGIMSSEVRRDSPGAVLDAIATLGISDLQLHPASLYPEVPFTTVIGGGLAEVADRLSVATLTAAIDAAAARGIAVRALDGTCNLIHPDPGVRRTGLDGLATVIEAAATSGVGIVTICSGTRNTESMWRPHPANAESTAWDDLVRSLSEAAASAERAGVVLALEPEISNVIASARAARRLLDRISSPALRILMDGANLFASGSLPRMDEVLDEAFELLGGDIVLAHAKDLDHDGEAGKVAAGYGALDYPHYLALLRDTGFDGAIILHALASTLSEDRYADSFERVRRASPPGYLAA